MTAGLLEEAPPRFSGALPLWYQLAQSLRMAILGLDHGASDHGASGHGASGHGASGHGAAGHGAAGHGASGHGASGRHPPARLPTEAQFARHFGVSVTTVRQALASLAADGLIIRHRRRGTFVNPDALCAPTMRVIGSAGTIAAPGPGDEIRVLGRARVPAATGLAARLGATGEAVRIRGLRLDGGVPVSHADHYLRPEHAERITDEMLATAPMTTILRNELSLPLTRIDSAVSARIAPAGLAALLQVDVLTPVLVSDALTYAAGVAPVDVTRTYYRGDRFTFVVSRDIP